MEIIRNINWGAYYFFNFHANRPPLAELRPVMQAFDLMGGYPFLGLLTTATLLILIRKKQTRMAAMVLLFTVLGVGLVEAVRYLLASPRPPANTMRLDEMYRSFPARPVFLGFLVLLNLGMALEYVVATTRYRVLAYVGVVLVALFIAMSQLFLAAHYLNDVLAGMTGGIGLALLCRAQKGGS